MKWLVVGAGAAGCVVARRFVEAGDEVTVVEAGADHAPIGRHDDVGPYFADPARVRLDAIVMRTDDGPPALYRQGLGVGGSSLINGSLLTEPVTPNASPSDGPSHDLVIESEEPWALGAVGSALLAADPSATEVRLARRDGERLTAADLFLRPVIDRVRLVTNTSIAGLMIDGRRVVGAVADTGEQFEADAVVLCGGAIQTPTLMLRSGLDTPGIGEGLQDHPAVTFTLQLKPAAVDPTAPTISVISQHPSSDPSPDPSPDPYGQFVALNHLPGAPQLGGVMAGLLVVSSRGRVSLPDPDGPPLVKLNQLATPDDRQRLGELAWAARQLVVTEPFTAISNRVLIDEHGTTVDALIDEAHVDEWVNGHLGGHHHVTSSCAIGKVTDPDGAVIGYDGLFVGDASLFPSVPAANPYREVLQLAWSTAGRMIQRTRR